MIKFKIVMGSINDKADTCMNKWLEDNKENIEEVIDFKYQQARYGDHSICIMYKEKNIGETENK